VDSNSKKTEVFLSLLMANQRKINSYILSVMPNFNDADDIMQETISVMWRKFDHYKIGSDFAGWGVKVAYYCVLNHRKQKSKDAVFLNETIFQQLNDAAKERQNDTDDRIKYLRQCIERLTTEDQRFLKARYELNNSAKSLSVQLDRSVQYVYKHLSRIHHLLNRCVNQALHEQEAM
jgi:RNA polymerase sigma-70 factor (ECF subfamily)